MEKEPTRENNESQEQRLARLLREKGPMDFETRELLNTWTQEQERHAEQSEGREFDIAQIQLNLQRARLYYNAGYVEAAFENFEAALTYAWNKRMEELCQEITKEMDELEDSTER